jgi:glyceraldehyde 3-phosphate dehydrogenase
MAIRIGINGFGRIGRNLLRAAWTAPDIEFVHINDLTSADMLAYLLERDSVHRPWKQARAVDGGLAVDGKVISCGAEKDPTKIPWGEKGVDIVLECTGVFTDGAKAKAHLDGGAKKVIISAPAKGVDGTYVVGVNTHEIGANAKIISNASCTTNCLAPLAKVLHESFGIVRGTMTTVHSYTMDQNLLDAPHKKGDFRRSRAAAINMVPTSTGAASAIGLVYPALAGKLDGLAIRVPTANGSLTDLTVEVEKDTTAEQVNEALRAAANGALKGILVIADDHTVSTDIIGNPGSSIVDLELTTVMGTRFVKVLSWYDNEWGFSNRMIDLARLLHKAG